MLDRRRVIDELRGYCNFCANANMQTGHTVVCHDAADMIEDDQKKIEILQNTIHELNRQLEQAGVITAIIVRRRRRAHEYR